MANKVNGTSANGNTETPSVTGKETPKLELSNLSVVVDNTTGELKTSEKSENQKPQLPPIAARLKRLEELQELSEKRETLVDHLENLNKFYIAPTGQGCNLKLTDSKGNSFGIANPIVIGEMIHMSKVKLQDELNRIEEAFVFEV